MTELTAFGAVDLAVLRWVRVGTEGRDFQLLSGDQAVGTLRWPQLVGSLATFESTRGTWTLKRGGFLAPHVSARDSNGTEAARLEMHGGQGLLRVGTLAPYRFRRAGMLLPAWDLADARSAPVLNVEPVERHGRPEGGLLTVAAGARKLPDLDLLVGVTWYFIVLAWLEEATVLAATAVLSAVSDPLIRDLDDGTGDPGIRSVVRSATEPRAGGRSSPASVRRW